MEQQTILPLLAPIHPTDPALAHLFSQQGMGRLGIRERGDENSFWTNLTHDYVRVGG